MVGHRHVELLTENLLRTPTMHQLAFFHRQPHRGDHPLIERTGDKLLELILEFLTSLRRGHPAGGGKRIHLGRGIGGNSSGPVGNRRNLGQVLRQRAGGTAKGFQQRSCPAGTGTPCRGLCTYVHGIRPSATQTITYEFSPIPISGEFLVARVRLSGIGVLTRQTGPSSLENQLGLQLTAAEQFFDDRNLVCGRDLRPIEGNQQIVQPD